MLNGSLRKSKWLSATLTVFPSPSLFLSPLFFPFFSFFLIVDKNMRGEKGDNVCCQTERM